MRESKVQNELHQKHKTKQRRENRNGKFGILFMRSRHDVQYHGVQFVYPGTAIRSKEVV